MHGSRAATWLGRPRISDRGATARFHSVRSSRRNLTQLDANLRLLPRSKSPLRVRAGGNPLKSMQTLQQRSWRICGSRAPPPCVSVGERSAGTPARDCGQAFLGKRIWLKDVEPERLPCKRNGAMAAWAGTSLIPCNVAHIHGQEWPRHLQGASSNSRTSPDPPTLLLSEAVRVIAILIGIDCGSDPKRT